MTNYRLSADQRAITCLTCGRTSHHPMDVGMRYCGHCHAWIGGLRCDFCDGEYPVFKDYKAKLHFVGKLKDGRVVTDTDGLWSACAECAALIDANRWDDLEDRCYVGHLGRWELLGLALSRSAAPNHAPDVVRLETAGTGISSRAAPWRREK